MTPPAVYALLAFAVFCALVLLVGLLAETAVPSLSHQLAHFLASHLTPGATR